MKDSEKMWEHWQDMTMSKKRELAAEFYGNGQLYCRLFYNSFSGDFWVNFEASLNTNIGDYGDNVHLIYGRQMMPLESDDELDAFIDFLRFKIFDMIF